MFPMQGTPEEAERHAYQDQRVLVFSTIWIVWLLVLIYIGFVAWLYLQDEEVKLRGLHATMRFFQAIARNAGVCALLIEQRYNDHIELLH